MKTYLEKLQELRKEYSHKVCLMILSGEHTVEQVDRCFDLLSEFEDRVSELNVDSEYYGEHGRSSYVSDSGIDLLRFLVESNVTQDELKLMLKLGE